MRAKLVKILKDLVIRYDAVDDSDEQSRANALVLIQTATVNLINFNQFELGTYAVAEAKAEMKRVKDSEASK